MTRVGAESVGRIGRASIRKFDSIVARSMPGLAHMRSNIASWRIDWIDGNINFAIGRASKLEALSDEHWRRLTKTPRNSHLFNTHRYQLKVASCAKWKGLHSLTIG
jgi:hypothetical protein